MQSRLPTILGKAIEDTTRTLNDQSSEEKVVDLVACIERMADLMSDLSGNHKLRPIIDDDEADVALWNKEIAKYFQGKGKANLVSSFYFIFWLRNSFTSTALHSFPLPTSFNPFPFLRAHSYFAMLPILVLTDFFFQIS